MQRDSHSFKVESLTVDPISNSPAIPQVQWLLIRVAVVKGGGQLLPLFEGR